VLGNDIAIDAYRRGTRPFPDGSIIALSLAKTLSDSLRSPEIRQSVHRPKTARLVGGRTTGIVRRWPCTVTPESRLEDGAWAGWAAELDR
jgi:hypothetical protein